MGLDAGSTAVGPPACALEVGLALVLAPGEPLGETLLDALAEGEVCAAGEPLGGGV